jgi:hypothetical protein
MGFKCVWVPYEHQGQHIKVYAWIAYHKHWLSLQVEAFNFQIEFQLQHFKAIFRVTHM